MFKLYLRNKTFDFTGATCVALLKYKKIFPLFPKWVFLRKRSEIVVEFFNSMLSDNCGKAVHDEYPVVFEQVITVLIMTVSVPGKAIP